MEYTVLMLKPHFTRNGTNYKQVYRQGKYSIYALSKEPFNTIIGFDVIEIMEKMPYEVNSADYLPEDVLHYNYIECYPENKYWGVYAWSYTTLTEAFNKYDKLIRSNNAN